jgi:hypothetical protein
MSAIRPLSKVSTQQREGCTGVMSYSRHWPCRFPQYGPGRKHIRTIELQSWQQTIVAGHPGHFARGLFHSDGYRGINRVRAQLADGDRWYEYPRYLFTNESSDILGLCRSTDRGQGASGAAYGIRIAVMLSAPPASTANCTRSIAADSGSFSALGRASSARSPASGR